MIFQAEALNLISVVPNSSLYIIIAFTKFKIFATAFMKAMYSMIRSNFKSFEMSVDNKEQMITLTRAAF